MAERTKRPDLLTQRMATLRKYDATSKWQESIDLSTVILKQLSRRKESPEILALKVDVINALGKAFRCTVQQRLAIPCFEEALSITEKTGNQEQRLMTLGNLVDGWRTYSRDKKAQYPPSITTEEQKKAHGFQKAIFYAEHAQELIRQMPTGFSEAKGHAWNQFGLLYTEPEIADHQKALDAYIPAEEGFRLVLENDPNNVDLQERLARTIHLKGVALENLGRLPEAEVAQRDSLKRSLKMGHVRNIGNAANSLGDVLLKLSYPDEAFYSFMIAKKISEKDGKITDQEIHDNAVKRLAQFQNPLA